MKSPSTRPMIERLVIVAKASTNGKSAREIAEKLEVSPKTIYRDRDFLRWRLGFEFERPNNGPCVAKDNRRIDALRSLEVLGLEVL